MNNDDQREFWATQSNWVTYQDAMDKTLAPVLDLVIDRAGLLPGQSVLDIGCGTGASLLAAVDRVGPSGHVTGADISPALLDLAQDRTKAHANIALQEADAAQDDLTGPYDALISRFGVMFFSDTAGAFAHIRRALKPGARLTMATWAPPPQNPFFMTPAKAAQAVLGEMPKSDRTLPGPFAMEDPNRIIPMFEAAGLSDVACDPVALDLTPAGNRTDLVELSMRIGPAPGVMRHHEASAEDAQKVHDALYDAFSAFETVDGTLRIPAVINLYTATA